VSRCDGDRVYLPRDANIPRAPSEVEEFMPAYSRFGERLGRPANPARAFHIRRERRSNTLVSFDRFCTLQRQRLMQSATAFGEDTYLSPDDLKAEYRWERLGPALDVIDKKEGLQFLSY
jgi:hypothetical protein